MTRINRILILAVMAVTCLNLMAQQGITFRGVYQISRDDNNDVSSEYVGWNYELQKAIFIVPQGLYKMVWDGATVFMPEKDPAVNKADFYSNGRFTDNAKALWAANFNMMQANSGAVIKDGILTTIMSRTDMQNPDGTWVTNDTNRFAVRKWDIKTGDLLTAGDVYYPAWQCLESAGMAVNPKDGKVYGLFHITNKYLPDSILNDPDFFAEENADSTDSGYAICTIDLDKMEIHQITPGLYYQNFVTFAINSEGRAFAMTSGGTIALPAEDGKVYDINGDLTGAHVFEFDLNSGLMLEDNRVNTGYMSQVKRQSACFAKDDPTKMYWMGYYNSGMGFDDNGNWNPLSDRTWRQNGKYDTSLYEVDITTGEARRIANIEDRYMFALMWIDGEEEPDVTGGVRGDVDGNGKVNIDDVTVLIDYLLTSDATGLDLSSADCNTDGKVNIDDVTALIDYLLTSQW